MQNIFSILNHGAGLGLLIACMTVLSTACSSARQPTIQTVDFVDLERFMGDWYVIANIPTRFERGAHNAVESYNLVERGDDTPMIETTFRFRKDAFDGPEKIYTPTGFVHDESTNAEWRMRFVWPFKSEYLIVWLDEDYATTMIGRSKLDYLWIMARDPEIPEADLDAMIEHAAALGYDTEAIQMVPQRWPSE